MTLGSFVEWKREKDRERLEEFQTVWLDGQINDPDNWPIEMSLEDWLDNAAWTKDVI